MKILKTRSQLRYTLETGRKVIFEPGAGIGIGLPGVSGSPMGLLLALTYP